MRVWIRFIWLRIECGCWLFKDSNKLSGFIIVEEFLEQLSD
jgi:hypothetical protein